VDGDFHEYDGDDVPPNSQSFLDDSKTLIVFDSSSTLRCSSRLHNKYATFATTMEWANVCTAVDLLEACAVEAHQHFIPTSEGAHSWERAPRTIRDILNMPDGIVRRAWLALVKKILKMLFDAGTFVLDTLLEGEIHIPVMELFKVKINSDGSLDKQKTHMVVQGDLLSKHIAEDRWSPAASFCTLKIFLAHAAKPLVRQLDFVGAF
jgi:hypothetical protein